MDTRSMSGKDTPTDDPNWAQIQLITWIIL